MPPRKEWPDESNRPPVTRYRSDVTQGGTYKESRHIDRKSNRNRSQSGQVGDSVSRPRTPEASDRDWLSAVPSVKEFSGLDAVGRPRTEGVAQYTGDTFSRTEIGGPLRAEDAFDGDDNVVLVGLDDLEERLGLDREIPLSDELTVLIEDTNQHRSRMETAAAVESVLGRPTLRRPWLMNGKVKPMLFMIIEDFRPGQAPAIYRRFRDLGRMMPEGVKYVSSWIDLDFRRCFQVMEAKHENDLKGWTSKWEDLMDFEIIPVQTSAEAVEKIAPQL